MNDLLRDVLAACERHERIANIGETDVILRTQHHFDLRSLRAIESVLAFADERLGIRLELIGGGYGCARFNFRINAHSHTERLRKFWALLHDEDLLERARAAGFETLITREPSGYANLMTGDVRTEPVHATASLFCSYSHADRDLQLKLKRHFEPLRLEGYFATWFDDAETRPGGRIHQEIQQHLRDASIILLLVSSDFFASSYIRTHELPIALQRHSAQEATAVPVILRPVKWEITQLRHLKALPQDGVPITQWPGGLDAAFVNVVDGIYGLLVED